MDENETMVTFDAEKQAKFMEESKERMSKICSQISLLEKVASKRSVDYTEENIEKMFSYLEGQLSACKDKFMEHFSEQDKSKKFDFDF